MLKFIGNPIFKKGLGVASIVVSGVTAVIGALADQRKAREFEEIKRVVSELQKK